MSTYGQWARNRKVSRAAWVCGTEAALRYDVVSAWQQALPGASRYNIHGGEGRPWDFLLSVPAEPRLITVWDAEKLDSLHRMPFLLEPEFGSAYTVFVSADGDFPRTAGDGTGGGRPQSVLSPPMAALRDSRHGQIIRCCAPSDYEGRAALVGSWWQDAGKNLGAALLDRTGDDLEAARQATLKACYAGISPSLDALELICPPSACADFADQVIAGNVRAAMAAAAATDPEEIGSVLGLLSSRLGMLAVLGDAARRGASMQDTAIRLKIDAYAVRLLRPHAAAYTRGKVARCRSVLALAEDAWRAGARTGVLEAVSALW